MTVKLTTDILVAGCGSSTALAGQWLAAIQAACDAQGISNSASSTAAFLANVGVESMGLTNHAENLNYTAVRLAQVWPQRYAVSPQTDTKIPNNLAVLLAGQGPQAIANDVYANRMGNGPASSGDGWNYRGQGLIQLTGRAQYMNFFAAIDVPLNTDTSELQTTELGASSAAWFFVDSDANDAGIQGDFDTTVQKINGQPPCAGNQGSLRQARYAAALPLCSAANIVAKSQSTKKTQTTPPVPQQ